MAKKGVPLLEEQVKKIIKLLDGTDMTITQIAERMGCHPTTIQAINRKQAVRDYKGQRSEWTISTRMK